MFESYKPLHVAVKRREVRLIQTVIMAERRSFDMKPDVDAVENVIDKPHHESHDASGTVNLYQDGTVVLVPTPSPDPKGKHSIAFNDTITNAT